MQLPIAQLMNVAGGAVNFLQKVFSQGSIESGFDAELGKALQSGDNNKPFFMEMLNQKGMLDDDTMKGMLAHPECVMIFQYMSALKKMGINVSDIKALLAAKPAEVSDDALGTLLKSLGISGADLDRIMKDAALKAEIKTNLTEAVKQPLNKLSGGETGIDIDEFLKFFSADDNTLAVLEKNIQAIKTSAENAGAIPGTIPSMGIAQASEEIKALIAQALKKSQTNANIASKDITAGIEKIGAHKVEGTIDFIEQSLNIKKETLRDLFFSTDPDVRGKAADEVDKQISAFMDQNQGKALKPEMLQALSLLKSSMSEKEFSGIDNILKQWNMDTPMIETRPVMDKEMFTSITKRLGADSGQMFEKQVNHVMDQLRKTIPAHMKNSEGQVTLRLHPPVLGRVDVKMSMVDGQLQAAFRTDHAFTRDMLQQNMHILKDALAEQGIKANTFSVTAGLEARSSNGFSLADQDRSHPGFSQQNKRQSSHNKGFEDDEDFVYASKAIQGLQESGRLDVMA